MATGSKAAVDVGKDADSVSIARMHIMRTTVLPGLGAALVICALHLTWSLADDLPLAASGSLSTTNRQARQLLQQHDHANAVLLLEAQMTGSQGNAEYLELLAEAYQGQFDQLQRDGKVQQAAQLWDKLAILQPKLKGMRIPAASGQASEKPLPVKARQSAAPEEPLGEASAAKNDLTHAESAFQAGQFDQARQGFHSAQLKGVALSEGMKERLAYCKLRQVAERLNATSGNPGTEREGLTKEVREAAELAPRLEFSRQLLEQLKTQPSGAKASVRHLPNKHEGWLVSETTHFTAYHQDANLAEQALQIAEQTRAAVCRKWLGHEVSWSQPCQIYVHPTADSYHRQSGMPTSAPGHSDYDADKNDASNIHYRRVFVRADHAHMLTAILPHEVTHVVLNGQVGRKLLPRWADEGMAVLSEPYSRIALHLEPLPRTYQSGRALGLAELLRVEAYPQDRSQVATFYGQSVCLVEYLTSLRSPREFVAFMRDANEMSEEAALQKHYGMSVQVLEEKLKKWIVSEHMPTLMAVK